MSDIKIALNVDANNPDVGDYYLENGTIRLTENLSEAVAQELYVRFKSFKGEWFLDRTVGIPYFQAILGQKTPIGIVAQIFRTVIIGCPGIASLDRFSLTQLPNRNAQLDFSCTLDDGTTLTSADFAPFVVTGVG